MGSINIFTAADVCDYSDVCRPQAYRIVSSMMTLLISVCSYDACRSLWWRLWQFILLCFGEAQLYYLVVVPVDTLRVDSLYQLAKWPIARRTTINRWPLRHAHRMRVVGSKAFREKQASSRDWIRSVNCWLRWPSATVVAIDMATNNAKWIKIRCPQFITTLWRTRSNLMPPLYSHREKIMTLFLFIFTDRIDYIFSLSLYIKKKKYIYICSSEKLLTVCLELEHQITAIILYNTLLLVCSGYKTIGSSSQLN